jgi:UDP-N-acetylglucosamine 2-epimerase (non-hydrolysing)
VFITGNTVIDALDFTLARHRWRVRRGARRAPSGRKRILVTAHRRESFGAGIDEICAAITDIVERDDSVEIVLPMHPNPEVRIPVQRALSANPRIRLSPPLDYPDLIALMRRSSIVLTDSGGLQEEAPALGVPVVVMRDSTERPEIIEAGGAVLAGPHRRTIVAEVERILSNRDVYEKMSRVRRPFGDGHAAARIRRIIYAWFQARSPHGIRSIRKKVEYHP